MKEKSVNKITPVMKQYWEAKRKYPNSIMLFRMGDFYETFDEDAKITSKILGITLTKRANGAASSVPLAGFPYHAYEQHVHKLLKSGHKVALCEQVEDPKQSKGIVKRAVVELLSPGTAINNEYLSKNKNNYLASVKYDKDNLGFAILDNSTGEMFCGNIMKNNIADMLYSYNVTEVLLPESQKVLLPNVIEENFMISTYEDWKSEYSSAYNNLLEHFNTKSLKGFGIENEEAIIVSSNACINYIKTNYFGKVKHINSITKINHSGYMHLDNFTIKNLELFESLNNDKEATLFYIINHTKTSMGARMLRYHLSHPLLDIKKINSRLNCTQEYIKNCELLETTKDLLSQTSDIERIIGKISNEKSNPADLINLSNSLKIFEDINSFICNNTKFNKFLKKSYKLTKIIRLIFKIIKKEPAINLSKGGYINSNVNKELDNLRNISSKANNWLTDYQISESEKLNIPSLKIKYNKVFGYYIDITKTHIDKIPENYIRKQTLVNSERYFTEELKEYENKILSAEDRIVEIEKEIYYSLTQEIMNYCSKIQNNAKALAEIDVLCSHASVSIENNYVKPKLNNKTNYNLDNSRHPVVEKLLPITEEFISNDLSLVKNKKEIAIITGPNMAGKSTFLRQVALIALLAQIGSYVPADKCELGIVDKIFTRVGASDNLARGESTFLVEMNEAANILNNATEKSLIILDEIGRGTSTFDGVSLAWAITEYLHNHKRARTLFATHYHELISLAEKLKVCFNLNVKVEEYKNEVVFLRKIIEGGASKSYGIHVAKMAGIPIDVIKRATVVLKSFRGKKELSALNVNNIKDIQEEQLDLFTKVENEILKEIKNVNVEKLTPIEALNFINKIKNKL